jgi:ligand-binding sensor domain-containing protein/DNA-binding response OmpR family regulator
MLKAALSENGVYSFEHYFIDKHFICSDTLSDNTWFGTKDGTIILFDNSSRDFINAESPEVTAGHRINILKSYSGTSVIAGLDDGRIIFYNKNGDVQEQFVLNSTIRNLYTDRYNNIWITTEDYGIHKIDTDRRIRFYILTPEDKQPLVDDEREYIYEDINDNLWIGIHGAGLALYDRQGDRFNFLRNNPYDPASISSNFIHCLTNDKSGILWVGTVQAGGGINKAIPANPAFSNIIPISNIKNTMDNFVRSMFQDSYGNIWMGSKSANIYVYDDNLNLIYSLQDIPSVKGRIPGHNIYTIIQDSEGYLWMGSKGGGIAVSEKPLQDYRNNYREMKFNIYKNIPNDTNSLSSNAVYSIIKDRHNRMWIGTYGGGVNLMDRSDFKKGKNVFRRINTGTSNLSNDAIRKIYEDSRGRIWIGTTFGISLLDSSDMGTGIPVNFKNFIYTPDNKNNLSYNDVVHIFEDSSGELWFGTYGGGVNKLTESGDSIIRFGHLTSADGLCSDAVFGIIEDDMGYLWFSTEQGISRYNPNNNTFENYNENNGLISDKFSESTCIKTSKGHLIFGNTKGALVVNPDKLIQTRYKPSVVFTNFQLQNKDVDIHSENSPLENTIEYSSQITLRYNQSSFSISYAALSYFDPGKNEYAFMLKPFDNNWNYVGNQRKATYTNLSPGKYTFYLKAANWDGTWNETPNTIIIKINPPWWRTKLAYLVYFIIAVILTDISRRIFIRYLRMRNNLRVERKVNEIKLSYNEKENLISISIKDEGIGIPKNKQPYVFQRFNTLSDTESTYKGYGIGLALSYEIVKLHHGNIFIESEENKGACFIIELPAGRDHFATDEVEYVESKIIEHKHEDLIIEDTDEEETNDAITADIKKHKNQILIVEDHDEIKEYVQSILCDEYDVITSSNAFDALGKIEIYHPDAIITDVMMPRIDGIEFTRMLKENFDTSHIPVIMLTAKTAFEEQIAGIKSGAEAYILKPFNALHLKTVVSNILKQREIITRRLVSRRFTMPEDIKITHRDQAFLEKVRTIINNKYNDSEFNVEKLVEGCNMSRTVFYNKMKGLTGTAPVDFLRHMRLEIARKLLEESGENVTDIAYKTGFNDPKYFSRCFKELFGESPGAVKNNAR